ncbi:ABC transporter substrate-binding protein [Aeromicrobium sp. Leaf350]|uniref:ABC transporter substrate-binding protein n=1 Tax=Aeromicrobium sp. Leaf350 TaxID=2876565 RepID=UPI001E52AD78|nr:ABC transporter substrate-binding protein [Aeromicrobium sp. Leaf350]
MSRSRTPLRRITALAAVSVLGLGLAACGGDPTEGEAAASDTIVVGSASFPEAQIIAEIYVQALDAEGIKVESKTGSGPRETYIPALTNGELDLVPEYSGNLLSYLDPEATATGPDEIVTALADAAPDGYEVLDPAPAEDKDSLNVTPEFAEANGLTTIADLSKVPGFSLGANPEFAERDYGIPGLESVYGLTGIEFVSIPDGGGPETLQSLLSGDIDVADIYSTTPSIVENDLVTLEDPENLIAAQNIIPLINSDKATDEVKEILNKVSAELTTEDLLDLNAQNQGPDKTAPKDLAKQWLTDKGFL